MLKHRQTQLDMEISIIDIFVLGAKGIMFAGARPKSEFRIPAVPVCEAVFINSPHFSLVVEQICYKYDMDR